MPTEEPDPREVQQQQQMMQMNQAMMAAMFAPRPPPKNPTPAPMDIAQIMAAAQAHVQVIGLVLCHKMPRTVGFVTYLLRVSSCGVCAMLPSSLLQRQGWETLKKSVRKLCTGHFIT